MTTNTNMNIITAMVLNKYRENATTTVLKARPEADELTCNPTYENLNALLSWCSKRREAYSAMQDFYNKYDNSKKAWNAWNRWIAYTNLINAYFYYIDLYALKRIDGDYYKPLSYRIIKNELSEF